MKRFLAGIAVGVLVWHFLPHQSPEVDARLVESWSHNKLAKHADLVVIGSPSWTVRGEKVWNLKGQGIDGDLTKHRTVLKVLQVFKGPPLGQIVVSHYLWSRCDDVVVVDGPNLLNFRRKGFKLPEGNPPCQRYTFTRYDGSTFTGNCGHAEPWIGDV